MECTTEDLILKYQNENKEGADKMEIKELYKQPLLLCKNCNGLIAYKSFVIKETEDGVVLNSMSSFLVEEIIQDNNQVLVLTCSICENSLGIKFKTKFYLSKSAFSEKPYKLNLSIHSLTKRGFTFCRPLLDRVKENLGVEIVIDNELLKKRKLKDYKIPRRETDGCILIHRNDGRLLMTDRNGIYDSFIRRMFDKNKGNILIVILTMEESDVLNTLDSEQSFIESVRSERKSHISYYELLADKTMIKALADDGDQPLMALLAKHFKVIYVKEELNFFQNEYLTNFIYRCLHFSPYPPDFIEEGLKEPIILEQNFKQAKEVFVKAMRVVKEDLMVDDEAIFNLALSKLLLEPHDLKKSNCNLI